MFSLVKPFSGLFKCSNISRPVLNRSFHWSGGAIRGFEQFFDKEDQVSTGRGWTVPDLRRKSFEDLHKLWFVLYKERNLLLTSKQKMKRGLKPITSEFEERYMKVKRGMGAIKFVMDERKKIDRRLGVSSAIPKDYLRDDPELTTNKSNAPDV